MPPSQDQDGSYGKQGEHQKIVASKLSEMNVEGAQASSRLLVQPQKTPLLGPPRNSLGSGDARKQTAEDSYAAEYTPRCPLWRIQNIFHTFAVRRQALVSVLPST